MGIADLLLDLMVAEGVDRAEAARNFWGLGSRGLLTDALGDRMRPFQRPYARPSAETAGWVVDRPGQLLLADVVRNVHPTILIGTSGQAGSFTEAIVRELILD